MSTTRTFPILALALAKESWIYLQDNAPDIADALAAEVKPGVKPEEVRRFVMACTGREAIAARMEQAAVWLLRGEGE